MFSPGAAEHGGALIVADDGPQITPYVWAAVTLKAPDVDGP